MSTRIGRTFMKTQQYETLLLAHTEITDDELASIERGLESIASKSQGSLVSFDKWGKYLLAYPIKKNSYGVYALARFTIGQEQATAAHKEIDAFLRIKCNDIVLRFVTVKLENGASAAYQKPEPMDSTNVENLETLKDGKIEHILGSVGSTGTDDIVEEDMSFEEDESAEEVTAKA